MQQNKYVKYQAVKIYFSKNHLHGSKFLGPHNKPNGVHGLDKHYKMSFDTKIGNGTYAIHCIPCDCTPCTSIIDQPYIIVFQSQKNLTIN